MSEICFYEVLQVQRNASLKEVKSSFRKLAKNFHPDKNPGDREAESMFKLIAEAYEVLSDPEKRQKYDRYGRRGVNMAAGRNDDSGPNGFQGGGLDHARDLFSRFFSQDMGRGDPFMNSFFADSRFAGFGPPSRQRERQPRHRSEADDRHGRMRHQSDPFGSGFGSFGGGFGSSSFHDSFFSNAGFEDFGGGMPNMTSNGFYSSSSSSSSSSSGGSSSFSSTFSSSSSDGASSKSIKTSTTMRDGKRITTKVTTIRHRDGRVETKTESSTKSLEEREPSPRAKSRARIR